jgi:hypothetical protein
MTKKGRSDKYLHTGISSLYITLSMYYDKAYRSLEDRWENRETLM